MMSSRWVSLLEGIFFSNATLKLHCHGSLSGASSNSLINSTTRTRFIFPFSSGLVKYTLETKSFGEGPITTNSFPSESKRGSPNSSRNINSNCLKIGVTFSPLSLRKTNSLSSAVVLASSTAILDLVGYQCGLVLVNLG